MKFSAWLVRVDTLLLASFCFLQSVLVESLPKNRYSDKKSTSSTSSIPGVPPSFVQQSLYNAIRNHNLEFCKNILQISNANKFGAYEPTVSGFFPLHLAVQVGDIPIASTLLMNGADIDQIDTNEFSPIGYSIEKDNMDLFLLLALSGARLDLPQGKNQYTVLHIACRFGLKQIVEYVVADHHAIFVDAKTLDGRTALHEAISAGITEIIKLLLDVGASVHAQDVRGWTALHLSIASNNLNAAEELLKYDQTALYDKTVDGLAPLDLSIMLCQPEMTKLLLSFDPNIQDTQIYQTPVVWDHHITAGTRKCQETGSLLMEHLRANRPRILRDSIKSFLARNFADYGELRVAEEDRLEMEAANSLLAMQQDEKGFAPKNLGSRLSFVCGDDYEPSKASSWVSSNRDHGSEMVPDVPMSPRSLHPPAIALYRNRGGTPDSSFSLGIRQYPETSSEPFTNAENNRMFFGSQAFRRINVDTIIEELMRYFGNPSWTNDQLLVELWRRVCARRHLNFEPPSDGEIAEAVAYKYTYLLTYAYRQPGYTMTFSDVLMRVYADLVGTKSK